MNDPNQNNVSTVYYYNHGCAPYFPMSLEATAARQFNFKAAYWRVLSSQIHLRHRYENWTSKSYVFVITSAR